MSIRRVLLCLPEPTTEDALELARAVKAALSSTYQVRLQTLDGDFDEDVTPIEDPRHQPLLLRIEEQKPPDGGEGTM